MAVDVQGATKIQPYLKKANATYTTVVDETNSLGQLYGFKAIPNLFLIDSGGTVVFKELGTFNIREAGKRAMVDRWADFDEITDEGNTETIDERHGMSNQHFVRGQQFYRQGMVEEALAEWRRGVAIEPDNYNIRKQIWAIQEPNRFYDGHVDYEWQADQLAKGL